MIRVRPILVTAAGEGWARLLEGLGADAVVPPGSPFGEYGLDAGAVLLRDAGDGPAATRLGFTSDDVAGLRDRLAAAGVDVETGQDGLRARTRSGLELTVARGTAGRAAAAGGLSVMPIWFQPDAEEVRAVYGALGLSARIASDAPGGWADFVADGGGLAAQHHHDHDDEPGIELSFEYAGDLDVLAARLADAGHAADVHDEAYNRTLRVRTPEGAELWVNGVMDDLYGYHRVG